MTTTNKKEQLILQRIAKKKIKDLKEVNPDIIHDLAQSTRPGPIEKYTPEGLDQKINEYIADCKSKNVPLLMSGLALYLNIDRHTLNQYSKKDKYLTIINRYRSQSLNYIEGKLINKETFTPGQIFYLKNNYKEDYKDKVEIDQTITGSLSLVDLAKLADAVVIDEEEEQLEDENIE